MAPGFGGKECGADAELAFLFSMRERRDARSTAPGFGRDGGADAYVAFLSRFFRRGA